MTAMPRWARVALVLSPMMLVPIVFVAAIPWIRSVDRTVVSFAALATAVFVMGYSTYLSIRWQRSLDEVQKAGTRFGQLWGSLAGTLIFALLLNLPPFRIFVTGLVWDWAGHPDPNAWRKVVVIAMTFAFCAVLVLQTIGAAVATSIWWKRLSR